MPDSGLPHPVFSDADVEQLFRPFATCRRLGVAVSGGPDSTALLLLADRWRRNGPDRPVLHVLTVDHALRPQSGADADLVVMLAARLALPVSRLVWDHDGAPPTGDIQAEARKARYRLLASEATRLGLDGVFVAHTLDDQAETLLLRLQRGSGVTGLSGMPVSREIDGIRFVRPLLGQSKARLVACVEAEAVPYAIDPSNTSDRFLRARLRKLMPQLAALGLDSERLAGTARRMARADRALSRMTADLAARAATDHGGIVELDGERLGAAPDEIVLRLLVLAIRLVRPAVYPPRAEALEDWLTAFRAGSAPRRATMADTILDLRGDRLWLYAEAGRNGHPRLAIDEDGTHLWDGRFLIEVAGLADGESVEVSADADAAARDGLPREAVASLPRLDSPVRDGLRIDVRPLRSLPDLLRKRAGDSDLPAWFTASEAEPDGFS